MGEGFYSNFLGVKNLNLHVSAPLIVVEQKLNQTFKYSKLKSIDRDRNVMD